MITTEHNERRLCATIFGEFTLSDFKEFEDAVNSRLEFKAGNGTGRPRDKHGGDSIPITAIPHCIVHFRSDI